VNTLSAAILVAVVATVPLAAFGQTDHSQHMSTAKSAPPAAMPMTNGVVKKVAADRGEVTIAHDDIKNLDMPRMTMTFRVKDPAWTKKLKAGDKIRFVADMPGGELTVVAYEVVK
jgi:Cu(I)/Ag(I) efflux system protein CusF